MAEALFAGSMPAFYEQYMVPMIFEPYAEEMARRLLPRTQGDVLEIAAGTGVVTRQLAGLLPQDVAIVATDLSQPMLELAAAIGTKRTVQWRQADATQLPFANASFDAVVCQFGVMFFGEKSAAFAEVRRVLRPGGVFYFSVWDRIEENEFVHTVNDAVERMFPENPLMFMRGTPHGYHDVPAIARELERAGFEAVRFETVAKVSRAKSAREAAVAYCQGTPLRGEIEIRGGSVQDATDVATEALEKRFGAGLIEGRIRAHVVSVAVPNARAGG